MKELEYLVQQINSYPADIKAEVLIADLLEEGLSQDDFLIFFNSLFKRRYSRDILKADRHSLNDYEEVLAIRLARDGMYDLLPEGLFHMAPDTALSSGNAMASDSRKEQKVEEESRKFFQPIENEFFYQRTQLELEERKILQKLNDNRFDDFFLRFWGIDQTLPPALIARLSIMLPFVKEIVGNFELTSKCLSAILEEDVSFVIQYDTDLSYKDDNAVSEDGLSLGNAILGVNFMAGSHFLDYVKAIKFIIGPLKKTGVEPYLEQGSHARFIDCFCNYFIPIEMDRNFEIRMPAEQQDFILDSPDNQCLLGYSTII